VIGLESVAFDGHDGGPYVSVSDGRILKYGGKDVGWTTFAYSPSYIKNKCSSYAASSELPSKATESLCGRPLGLRFHLSSGHLYIADAYMGLMRVSPDGGEATEAAGGVPLSFTNGVDIDQVTGDVYFTYQAEPRIHGRSTRWSPRRATPLDELSSTIHVPKALPSESIGHTLSFRGPGHASCSRFGSRDPRLAHLSCSPIYLDTRIT
jgi:hypothetical protein